MNKDKVFRVAKKIVAKKGKTISAKQIFIGGGDLSGILYKDTSTRVYSNGKIKIEYYHEEFGKKDGEFDRIRIFERVVPLLPRILRYESIRENGSIIPEYTCIVEGNSWKKELESILALTQ